MFREYGCCPSPRCRSRCPLRATGRPRQCPWGFARLPLAVLSMAGGFGGGFPRGASNGGGCSAAAEFTAALAVAVRHRIASGCEAPARLRGLRLYTAAYTVT